MCITFQMPLVYFHFKFIACYSSLHGGAHANEIMHAHSHVVYVVLDPSDDYSYKAYAYITPQYSFKGLSAISLASIFLNFLDICQENATF